MPEAATRAAFSAKTKLVIFNTPHNPTGHVATEAELQLLADLCIEHDVLAISDEVRSGQVRVVTRNVTKLHKRVCVCGGERYKEKSTVVQGLQKRARTRM